MSQDTLSDVLRSIRLRGAVFYRVEGSARWVSETPSARHIAAMILPGVEHAMAYHVLTQGSCWATLIGESPILLKEGDAVAFPRGDAHVLSSQPGMRAAAGLRPSEQPRPERLPFLPSRQGEALARSRVDREDCRDCASLVCGFFGCDSGPFNPLLASLPHLLHVRAPNAGHRDCISELVRLASSESSLERPGGAALLERLSETMLVEIVRRYLDELPDTRRSWLGGLRDRYVGRALALLHEHPGDTWTIDKLADRVGLSRSALHERFAQFAGHPPMQYLAKWRMQVAARLLERSSAGVASIARDVGYESEAAFSRAFRRETGLPPATWRRERLRRAQGTGSHAA